MIQSAEKMRWLSFSTVPQLKRHKKLTLHKDKSIKTPSTHASLTCSIKPQQRNLRGQWYTKAEAFSSQVTSFPCKTSKGQGIKILPWPPFPYRALSLSKNVFHSLWEPKYKLSLELSVSKRPEPCWLEHSTWNPSSGTSVENFTLQTFLCGSLATDLDLLCFWISSWVWDSSYNTSHIPQLSRHLEEHTRSASSSTGVLVQAHSTMAQNTLAHTTPTGNSMLQWDKILWDVEDTYPHLTWKTVMFCCM